MSTPEKVARTNFIFVYRSVQKAAVLFDDLFSDIYNSLIYFFRAAAHVMFGLVFGMIAVYLSIGLESVI